MEKGKCTSEGTQIRINIENQVPSYIYDENNLGKVLAEQQQRTRFSPERLKLIMLHKNVTAYKIAKNTGIPTSNMYRIAAGEVTDPQLSTLTKIAEFLNISIFDLMAS